MATLKHVKVNANSWLKLPNLSYHRLLPMSGMCFTPTTKGNGSFKFGDLPLEILEPLAIQYGTIVFRGFDVEMSNDVLETWGQRIGTIVNAPTGAVWDISNTEDGEESATKNYNIIHSYKPLPLHCDTFFRWDGGRPNLQIFHCASASKSDVTGGAESAATIFVDTRPVLKSLSRLEYELATKLVLKYSIPANSGEGFYGDGWVEPLIQKHNVTGEEVIRFNEPMAVGDGGWETSFEIVEGCDTDEEKEFAYKWLLETLSPLLRDEEKYCYVHGWCEGDFVVADDRCNLHGRKPVMDGNRHLKRLHVGYYV